MIKTNRVEYKVKLTNGLEKEIVAFLNYKEGGVLYIGINSDGGVVDIDDYDDRLEITSAGRLSVIKNQEHFLQGDATIKEHLDILKRVGSTKAGYWEV